MNWGGVDGISGQFPAAARKPPPFPAFVITAEFTNFEKCSFWPGGNALKSFLVYYFCPSFSLSETPIHLLLLYSSFAGWKNDHSPFSHLDTRDAFISILLGAKGNGRGRVEEEGRKHLGWGRLIDRARHE